MKYLAIASLVSALFALPAIGYAAQHGNSAASATSATQAALSDGEIRKVDKDAKKITVRHGPLANLDMPPMTMVFQVKDPAMLDQVKAGDKVRFQAEKIDGAFTIVKIEPLK